MILNLQVVTIATFHWFALCCLIWEKSKQECGVPDDTASEWLFNSDEFNFVFEAWKSRPDYSTCVF